MYDDQLQAALLCAGFGTRLQPLTNHFPKPAIPFMHHPMAAYSLEAIKKIGIKRLAFNTHHLPSLMENALLPYLSDFDEKIVCLEPEEILGTAGGLREIFNALSSNKTTILYHADLIANIDLAPAIASHFSQKNEITLILTPIHEFMPLRGVFCDDTGQIVQIRNDKATHQIGPLREFAFTGIHIIEPHIIDEIPKKGFSCLISQIYPQLLKQNRKIAPYITTSYFSDIGNPKRYLLAQQHCLEEPQRLPPITSKLHQNIKIENPNSIIEPVSLSGNIRVSENTKIGPFVTITGNFDLENCTIKNATLLGNAKISQEQIQNTISFYTENTCVQAPLNP